MNDNTLQFPIPLLAYGKTANERLEAAITYATIATGMHRVKILSPAQVEEELSGVKLPKPNREITAEEIKIMALGCTFCGVCVADSISAARWRFVRFKAVEDFLQSWKAAGRTIPWTRVPKQMVFEARDGNAKTYQRFAALCAVNSVLGSKNFSIVTTGRIRAGMGGYSSGKLLFAKDGTLTPDGERLLATRTDGWKPPTRNQARTLLDNLVKSGLLHRFTPPGRGKWTYFSKALPAEQIALGLIKRASRSASNPKLKALGELLLSVKAGTALLSGAQLGESPLNSKPPLNREVTTQSPVDHHSTTTRPPLNAASNASLNASLNAEASAIGKEEGEKGNGETFTLPTLEEVQQYAASLHKKASPELASQWFDLHGADPKWKTRGWKFRCAGWIFDAIRKSSFSNDSEPTA